MYIFGLHIDLVYVVPVVVGFILAILFVIYHNRHNDKKAVDTHVLKKDEIVNSKDYKKHKNSKNQIVNTGIKKSVKVSDDLDQIRSQLLSADFGSNIADDIVSKMQTDKNLTLRSAIKDLLLVPSTQTAVNPPKTPYVILFVGVNGVGKTTSLGKIAYKLQKQGSKVVVAAADTFRAAAADQLETWAKRAGAKIVRKEEGADPASVAFEGSKIAVQENADYLLVDTAGRMHNNAN
ncbi:MAG: hypothetical protein LBM13_01945, partial [Candidatus Ancillula sp.]|nr:hypothetical protein [Candidatus Ancillula sp.]